MPEATYRVLSEGNPEWGRVAILPWDTEIFGFAVADYQAGALDVVRDNPERVGRALEEWATANEVELIGCSVTAREREWRAVLPAARFYYVDSTFNYAISRPGAVKFPRPLPKPWLATAQHQEAAERIAARAFKVGRYHADPFFPAELADLRYRRWLANTFASLSDTTRVYLIGPHDAPTAFTTATLRGNQAYLPFGASDPSVRSTTTGFAMFVGLLEDVAKAGVRRVQSKLSAGNTAMINLAAFNGARFSDPQLVFHWHAQNAPHLLKLPARQ